MTRPLLSLVIPVYRGEAFIADSIRTIIAELDRLQADAGERPAFELVVVCDGALDASAEAAASVDDPRVRIVAYSENRGKGFALCAGMEQSEGILVGWLDADLDIHPSVIVDASRIILAADVDAAVGSKRHGASQVDYPVARRILSWGYQQLARWLLRVGVPDTQVGAKVFRREAIATALPLLRVKRYAFDLEVLAVAAQFGFDRVEEVPIKLDYQFTGTGINLAAVWNMLQDTLAVVYRVHSRWYVHQFARMHRARLDLAGPRPVVDTGNLAMLRDMVRDIAPPESPGHDT